MWRFVRGLLALALLAYATICAGMYFAQDDLIFKKRTLRGDSVGLKQFVDDQVWFKRDGTELHGWLLNSKRPNLIVYYGGNAEEVSGRLDELSRIPGYAALAINYRGYGLSGGEPSAAALKADALWLLQQVRAQGGYDKVLLLGRSLGTGVAMHVAARASVSGVVLVTPYDRLSAVAEGIYPWLPVQLLLKHEFDSLAQAPKIKAPVLILAVEPDRIVPTRHARRLAEALGDKASFELIANATHINITRKADFWRRVRNIASGTRHGR